MLKWFLILVVCLVPVAAAAQDSGDVTADATTGATTDDRSFLTAFLEDNLSDLGRTVTIDGFKGALSSRATFDRLTIADADGVWITISGGAISWNRSALLSGRVEITELSADAIDVPRRPHAQSSAFVADGFSLPELPVSVSIGSLESGRLTLGAEVLGEAVAVTISGTAQIAAGEGSTDFVIRRIDGRSGQLSLQAAFANATRVATIDLLASEGPDGIAATLLGLPGRPSVELALHGSGPIDDFTTSVALATDGQPRLSGKVMLTGSGPTEGAVDHRSFQLSLAGDISPLLQPGYREVFGTRVILEAEGAYKPGESTELTRLVLDSDGLDLSGRLVLSPENIPQAAALTLRFGLDGQQDLLLPIPGEPTYVRNGTLLLRYDADKGDVWTLKGNLDGFRRTEVAIGALVIDGQGRVLQAATSPGKLARILGAVSFDAADLAFSDRAVAAAIGNRLVGQTTFSWQDGRPLQLRRLSARAGDMDLSGDLALSRQGLDLSAEGQLAIRAPDMSRFSAIAGRPIGGAAEMQVSGKVGLLSRAFDVSGSATGQGLTVGQPMIDRVLAGGSEIKFSAVRDRQGLTIRALDLAVSTIRAKIAGVLGPETQDLTARLDATDLTVFGNGFGGQLAADVTLSGPMGAHRIEIDGQAEGLRVGSEIADRVLAGTSQVTATAVERDGVFALADLRITNPHFSVEATAADAPGAVRISGKLADAALLAPGFPGQLGFDGRLTRSPAGYALELNGQGPGQASARISGTLAADLGSVDLNLSGSGQSAILNGIIAPRSIDGPVRFDLRMIGPPSLASLSGQIAGQGLRIAAPNERLSVDNGTITASISAGKAELTGTAGLSGGGSLSLSGPVDLAPPHVAQLAIRLDHARLRDPSLFETSVSGDISVDGPLDGGAVISGALTLHETEISVAAPNFNSAAIPRVSHVNEPAEVRAARFRAGLTDGSAQSPAARQIYGLDLTITAPARLFVRGRGLDAEMAGTVRLRGTSVDVQPSGHFDLIRGRLNLLGKRFVLDEGLVQLLGSFVPYISFSASADTFGSTATIVVEGPANAPAVHFTSSNGLPEEEVISELLFGDGLNDISAFQLVQLANAVATLTGRGGEGVIMRLRKSFGLDDLDITADEDGNAALKAGKYLSDKIYSEASVGSDGKSRIDLNLDVNSDLTLRGTVGTDGTTGVGIFFDKDY